MARYGFPGQGYSLSDGEHDHLVPSFQISMILSLQEKFSDCNQCLSNFLRIIILEMLTEDFLEVMFISVTSMLLLLVF